MATGLQRLGPISRVLSRVQGGPQSHSFGLYCVRGSRLAQSRLPRMTLNSETMNSRAFIASPMCQRWPSGDGLDDETTVDIASAAYTDTTFFGSRAAGAARGGRGVGWASASVARLRAGLMPLPPCTLVLSQPPMGVLQLSPLGHVVPGLEMLIVV